MGECERGVGMSLSRWSGGCELVVVSRKEGGVGGFLSIWMARYLKFFLIFFLKRLAIYNCRGRMKVKWWKEYWKKGLVSMAMTELKWNIVMDTLNKS